MGGTTAVTETILAGAKRARAEVVDATIDDTKRIKVDGAAVKPSVEAEDTVAVAVQPRRRRWNIHELNSIVISLDRRPDRMEECSSRLKAACPCLKFEKFSATDGMRDSMDSRDVLYKWNTAKNTVYQKQRSVRKGWDDLDSYKVRDLVLSPGERGCAVSHVRAWKRCLEEAGESDRPLIVLEDDAAPTEKFTKIFESVMNNVPEDAHVLYLGYSQAADWRRSVSEYIVESEYVWTTVGYVIWPEGARLLLSQLPVNQPVDNWMALLAAENKMKSYCVVPKIIRQSDAWNANSDIRHSDEHYWGADSDIRHSDEFYWGSFTANTNETYHDGVGGGPLGNPELSDMSSDESVSSDDDLDAA